MQAFVIRFFRLIIVLSVILVVASCASRKAVERSAVRLIDSIRYDVRYVDSVSYQTVRRDSVYLRDSIVVKVDSTGKTTDRWHVVYKYVADDTILESYRAKIDSMSSISRKDSIVTKIITKEPTKFQKFRMDAFWIMSGLIMILLFFLVKRFS
jgi:hypothetical protein